MIVAAAAGTALDARLAAGEWNRGGQIGLVVGATFPAEVNPLWALDVADPAQLSPARRGLSNLAQRAAGLPKDVPFEDRHRISEAAKFAARRDVPGSRPQGIGLSRESGGNSALCQRLAPIHAALRPKCHSREHYKNNGHRHAGQNRVPSMRPCLKL